MNTQAAVAFANAHIQLEKARAIARQAQDQLVQAKEAYRKASLAIQVTKASPSRMSAMFIKDGINVDIMSGPAGQDFFNDIILECQQNHGGSRQVSENDSICGDGMICRVSLHD